MILFQSLKKILIVVLTLCVIVIIADLFFHAKEHDVVISNLTNGNVVISTVRINDKIFNVERLLKPKNPEKYELPHPEKNLRYSFKAFGDAVLIIDIKDQNNKPIQMSCKLIDPNGAGCTYYASILDTGELSCFCDSLADGID